MGHTTEFYGSINLSRKLTLVEARDWLDMHEAIYGLRRDEPYTPLPSGFAKRPDSYLQWVPTDDLGGIMWDGNEKFYSWAEWMAWVCAWLKDRGIRSDGEILWNGGGKDVGVLHVDNSVVLTKRGATSSGGRKPLTMESLGRMALDAMLGDGERNNGV